MRAGLALVSNPSPSGCPRGFQALSEEVRFQRMVPRSPHILPRPRQPPLRLGRQHRHGSRHLPRVAARPLASARRPCGGLEGSRGTSAKVQMAPSAALWVGLGRTERGWGGEQGLFHLLLPALGGRRRAWVRVPC